MMTWMKVLWSAAAAVAATRSYLGTAVDTTVATTKTMTHNGGVRTGRWVVGIVSRMGGGTPADPTSVTFCGTALTKLVGQSNAANVTASIWISTADITSDGTDNVVATFATSQSATRSFLWAVNDLLSMAAGATAGSTADPGALDINTQSGGLAFAVSADVNSTATVTWTGLTEDYDGITLTFSYSAASAQIATGSTPLTVSVDYSAGTVFAACSVALR